MSPGCVDGTPQNASSNNNDLLVIFRPELLPPSIPLEELFDAYFSCRKNKRRTANAAAFEVNYEENLVALWREINDGTYMPGRSLAFIVNTPVKREIFAADFRDRIVHHLIVNKIKKGAYRRNEERTDTTFLSASSSTTAAPAGSGGAPTLGSIRWTALSAGKRPTTPGRRGSSSWTSRDSS